MASRLWRKLQMRQRWGCVKGLMYKPLPKRLNWEQLEARPQREGRNVVKGTNRRVVVVKSPDQKIFEQAIFIVKDQKSAGGEGGTNILREAEKVANEYLSGISVSSRSLLSRLPPAAFAVLGALFTGAVWLILRFLGI